RVPLRPWLYTLSLHDALPIWIRNRGAAMSASLAFYSLLSVIPLATFVLSLSAWFLGSAFARRMLAWQVSETFGHSVAESLRSAQDRKSTRLNSSHDQISYAVF